MEQGYGSFRNPNPKIEVRKLTIFPTGTFNKHYMRSYVTGLTGDSVMSIKNALSSRPSPGAKISSGMLGGNLGGFLSLSTQALGEISVPSGWDENRARFVLIIDVEHSVGSQVTTYYFQGFTDYYGVSGANLDENMKFYINSYVTTVSFPMNTPMGNTMIDKVQSSSNVVRAYNPQSVELMRPSDILSRMQTNHVTMNSNDILGYQAVDFRTQLNYCPQSSVRANNNPATYMSNLLNGYVTNKINNEMEDNGSYEGILTDAISQTKDPWLLDNPFIRWLSSQFESPIPINEFTLRTLNNLDQYLPHKLTVVSPNMRQLGGLPQAGQGEYWNTQSRETVAASVIFNALSAIMMDLFITNLNMSSTNNTIGLEVVTIINKALTPSGMDITRNLDIMRNRFEREVLSEISFNNQSAFVVEVMMDLFGSSSLSISLDGGPSIYYTSATFGDSLITPVITTNHQTEANVVNDFEMLLGSVGEEYASDFMAPTEMGARYGV